MKTSHGNLAGSRSKPSAHCSLLTALCHGNQPGHRTKAVLPFLFLLSSFLFLLASCSQEADDGGVNGKTETALNSVSAINAYLAGKTGSAAEPVPLSLSGFNFAENPELLSNDISAAVMGKFIALDLSACTMEAVFERGGITATARIITIALPASVTEIGRIAGAGDPPPSETGGAFQGFNALREITAPKVTSVGDYAFSSCPKLESIAMPQLTAVGKVAFYGCTALSPLLQLSSVTDIGISAFGAGPFTTVNLPKAARIGAQSFSACGALTTVSIPKAETIGGTAFNGTALASLTLGFPPPELQGGILGSVTGTLTIRIPAGTRTIYEAWQAANNNKLGGGTPQIIFSEL